MLQWSPSETSTVRTTDGAGHHQQEAHPALNPSGNAESAHGGRAAHLRISVSQLLNSVPKQALLSKVINTFKTLVLHAAVYPTLERDWLPTTYSSSKQHTNLAIFSSGLPAFKGPQPCPNRPLKDCCTFTICAVVSLLHNLRASVREIHPNAYLKLACTGNKWLQITGKRDAGGVSHSQVPRPWHWQYYHSGPFALYEVSDDTLWPVLLWLGGLQSTKTAATYAKCPGRSTQQNNLDSPRA